MRLFEDEVGPAFAHSPSVDGFGWPGGPAFGTCDLGMQRDRQAHALRQGENAGRLRSGAIRAESDPKSYSESLAKNASKMRAVDCGVPAEMSLDTG